MSEVINEAEEIIERFPGPRVTFEQVEAAVAGCYFFTAAEGVLGHMLEAGEDDEDVLTNIDTPLKMLTFCILVLQNGFTVTGQSACASPENFDAEFGQDLARRDALTKIWPLLGYELRTQLSNQERDA